MSALDNMVSEIKSLATPLQDLILHEAMVDREYAEKAAAELAALREQVEKLEERNRWWLENYDITMPCGHKNRYLATKGNGELVLDDEGNALCVICSMEEAQ